MVKSNSYSPKAILIWLIGIVFFFYEFFLRVLPATLSKVIIPDLSITNEQFALIGSAYYITYAIMQVPAGLLLDKYSIRPILSLACLLCSLGTLWIGFSSEFYSVFIARLMIGFGSSFGFIALMVITLTWLPKKAFATFIGAGQFVGALGPLAAGAPVALALEKLNGNWREIFFACGFFGMALLILVILFVKDKPLDKKEVIFIDKTTPLGKGIKSLLQANQVWAVMFFASFSYVTMPLLGAFWGTLFLETKGLSLIKASFACSMIWIALAIGCAICGRFSDAIKRRKPVVITLISISLAASILLLVLPTSNFLLLSLILFLVGFGCSVQNLSFAIMADNAPAKLSATALALNNTLIMFTAAILPPFVTSIINHFSEGEAFTETSFIYGFSVIPLFFMIALFVIVFGVKETFCRKQNSIITIR